MKWTQTSPTTYPITWPQVKQQCRLDGEDERELVADIYIPAAVSHAEQEMGCSLMARTITATYYAGDDLVLPRGPVLSITSVLDHGGNAVTYERSAAGKRERITFTSSATYPVVVTYVAGHASASAIDARVKAAILAHVATMLRYREESTTDAVNAVHRLDQWYRKHGRGSAVA